MHSPYAALMASNEILLDAAVVSDYQLLSFRAENNRLRKQFNKITGIICIFKIKLYGTHVYYSFSWYLILLSENVKNVKDGRVTG